MANVNLFNKLAQIEVRYEEMNRELAQPEVLADSARYQKLAKAHAEMRVIVDAYREWKQVEKGIEEARALLDDPEMKQMAHEEMHALDQKKEELERRLKLLLLPKDPNDEKNVIVEIRAGTGGDEATLFAQELFRMYTRYAESQGWKVEVLSTSPSTIGGLKEVVASIEGDKVYSRLKYESGVHRVQRVPQTEQQGRIHTSAATVAVLPEAEEIDQKIEPKDLRVDTFCSSGPGGQSVNTTYSAVRITHLPTGMIVTCQDEKSQIKNKAKAMRVMRSRLYDMELAKQQAAQAAERRAMVKTGDRSEKIRTYNFPQNRVTDHRIGLTLHQLPEILDGRLQPLVDSLVTHFQTERLKQELVEA
jgi:peptide chain release factor 1